MLILLLSILIISFLYIYIFSNLFIANGNMEYGWRDFRIYRLGDIVLNKDLDNIIHEAYGIKMCVPMLLEAKIGNNWLDTVDVV